MAERDGFRTSFRGFNRQDVMDYMDSVQADFSEREAGLRQGLTEANACLASLTAENEQLKTAAAEAAQKAESIRAEAFDRFEQMNAQLIMLKKENERLKAAPAPAPASASSADTDELLSMIDELRTRGTEYLAATAGAGDACLDEMDRLIETLSDALEQMRSNVGAARADLNGRKNAAGLRLAELEASLKGEAPLKPSPAAPSPEKPAAQPSAQPAATPAAKPAQQSAPAAQSARLVSQPTRPRDGLRRFLDGLLG